MNLTAYTTSPSFRSPQAAYLVVLLSVLSLFLIPRGHAINSEAPSQTAAPGLLVNAAAAEAAPGHSAGAAHAEGHHGLPSAAPTFGDRSKGAWVNSSMIVTWIVALLIIGFAQYATRRIRSTAHAANHVPKGAENVWEFLVEGLHNFLTEIIGPQLARKTFWFFATIFIFILAVNWFGLLPGVGTVGWGVPPDPAHPHSLSHVTTPIFRGGNADLNMTAAMSLIFFACWLVWALQFNGVVGFFKHLFGAKGGTQGFMKAFLTVIFLVVGALEVISILFRPVSLSFRLYGNIFAGENLLESMQMVVPALGWLVPIPFYFMELLVGLVQALVFMLLTAVFTLLICSHDEEHGHEEGHAH
ncbi:MAG: F0F1 ATP synthase subunit A [Chthoniobacteraceae bacterium]